MGEHFKVYSAVFPISTKSYEGQTQVLLSMRKIQDIWMEAGTLQVMVRWMKMNLQSRLWPESVRKN